MHRHSGDPQVRILMDLVIVAAVGYLVGSVPFAYIIGKAFYRIDVRNHGSGNLGGSNTGRVLGKKAGVAVMTMDLLKVTLSVFLSLKISHHSWNMACGALSAAIGHCYPIYVRFRGGKAVAALYGFLFALWSCAGYSALVFFCAAGYLPDSVGYIQNRIPVKHTVINCCGSVYLCNQST